MARALPSPNNDRSIIFLFCPQQKTAKRKKGKWQRGREGARSLVVFWHYWTLRTLGEEELDEVGAVLARGARDERHLALAVALHRVHLAALVLRGREVALHARRNRDRHIWICLAAGGGEGTDRAVGYATLTWACGGANLR
jgi:hypothetical protein